MAIEFDETALHTMGTESDAFHTTTDGADKRAHGVADQVAATHTGMPRSDVDAELRSKLAAAGIHPHEPGFAQITQAISGGMPAVGTPIT
jgi:hypothetical protein